MTRRMRQQFGGNFPQNQENSRFSFGTDSAPNLSEGQKKGPHRNFVAYLRLEFGICWNNQPLFRPNVLNAFF